MTSSPSGTSSGSAAPPLIAAHAGLLPAVTGDRVLDIACGQGHMSRYLASLGADVTGIDISAAMLGNACAAGPDTITYIHADVTRDPAWWDGRPFDGCTCELALMDIDDLAGTLSTVTAVLRPGGWFAASIVHPCSPGNELGRSSWPPGQGYECEGWADLTRAQSRRRPDPGRCHTPQAVHLPERPA
jgi:ubiquinone/menaquinone biosynthesis C-methylase UbiE